MTTPDIPEEGARIRVEYDSVYAEGAQTLEGVVAAVSDDVAPAYQEQGYSLHRVDIDHEGRDDRTDRYAEASDLQVARRLTITGYPEPEEPPTATLYSRNGGRWNRISTGEPTWEVLDDG